MSLKVIPLKIGYKTLKTTRLRLIHLLVLACIALELACIVLSCIE